MLLVLPEVSLVWNLIVVKLYLSVISSNFFFITSETEQLFIFTGHLAVFSHQLLFCLFLKINLNVFLHYVAFFFSLSFMESSIVLNFQMLIKSSLLNILFGVCNFSFLFGKKKSKAKTVLTQKSLSFHI